MIRKRLLSACLALALCLSLLPVTALAAAPSGQVLYVGNVQISSTGYWTTSEDGQTITSVGDSQPSSGGYIHYDADTNTLTLHNATIKKSVSMDTSTFIAGAAIGVHNQRGAAELTITLEGTNTIAEVGKGIYVLANSTGGATLTITGDGSLDASASQTGIWVQSNSGNATLTIRNAKVEATGTSRGVNVQSHASSTASLTVDGGSLTASGSPGILYDSIGSGTVPDTVTLTISDSAIVDARNGEIGAGSTTNLQPVSPSGEGIVFNGDEGTVYGNVTLQEDLTIGEDESLTIPDGASLNTNGKLTVDGGTLNGTPTGDVTYKVTGVTLNKDSLILDLGGEETLTAAITPDNATNKNVTWESDNENVATVENGVVTAVGAGTATITVTTEDGSFTDTCQVTVKEAANVPVTSVSLDKTTLELTEGETAQLTATVLPDNATNKAVTWSTSNASIATVDANGLVTAVSAGTATITVTTEDGSFTAKCTVTVREDVPDRPVNIPDTHEIELIAGDGGEAKTSLTNAGAGTKITVTATPDAGYELAYITVDGERISGVSFTMPAHDVTVRVYFSGGALPFADVTEGAWYADAVSYVCANGLMDGVSASEFAPEANMTRAMVWTILARIDGETITGTSWAEDARAWAMESGVSDGTDPNGLVTREQFAAMLYRYAGEPAASGSLSAYTDADSVSEWATDAMLWATQNGIITGTTAATLAPQGAATRAQCAAMLMRFAER